MSWLKDNLTKMGILEKETVASAETVAAPPANALTNNYGITGTTVPSVNNDLLQALMTNVSKVVSPNNLDALDNMADTLKAAIVDEGTRIKAAAAALKLTNTDINKSVNELIAALEAEKATFMATDVAAMDSSIQAGITKLDTLLKRIEETITSLNDFTAQRDATTADVNNSKASRDAAVASFNATVDQAKAIIEAERNKVNIYLPNV